jgi:hypothetical protein
MQSIWITVGRGTQQFTRLPAKLSKIRSVRKLGHNVSYTARVRVRACREDRLAADNDDNLDSSEGGGLSPAREPGGALLRRCP